MINLDLQLAYYRRNLIEEVGISSEICENIGTKIEEELQNLTEIQIEDIISHSPISLNNRYEELVAFQRMMDYVQINQISEPGLVRSQVITQNYICFVYLKDSYFKALQNETESKTITHRCSKFLTSARIRKFRNSIAHGNWNYKSDFNGLEYWDYIRGRRENGYEKFIVSSKELAFWQTLSRVLAYASIETIKIKKETCA